MKYIYEENIYEENKITIKLCDGRMACTVDGIYETWHLLHMVYVYECA